MIELRNVQKSVPHAGTRSWLLRQIQLRIEPGDFITLMGPSGAGKSTLLNILGLMDAEYEGEYWLEGEALHQAKPKRRQQVQRDAIGFVFQHYHLIDDLTVAENLDLPLSYRDISKAERQSRVGELLDRFQIVGRKDLYPNQLSGGQQQLVAVARAIIARPRVLLADEPTGALHSDQGRMIMETLKALNDEGTTIVQVTHNAANAAYGKRTLQLRDGWMEGAGP